MYLETSVFICKKHGVLKNAYMLNSIFSDTYCLRCLQEDNKRTLAYGWDDKLTKEDFGAGSELLQEGIK